MEINRDYLHANGWKTQNIPIVAFIYPDSFITQYLNTNEYGYHFVIHDEDGEWWLQIDDTSHMSCGSLCVQSTDMLEYLFNNYGK